MNITLNFNTKKAELSELDKAYKDYISAYTRLWSVLHDSKLTNIDVVSVGVDPVLEKDLDEQ